MSCVLQFTTLPPPRAGAGSRVAWSVFWIAGLALVLLPSAFVADDNLIRPLVVLAVGACIVLGVTAFAFDGLPATERIGTIVVAALTVAAASIVQAGRVLSETVEPSAAFDLWLAVASAVLCAGAVLSVIRGRHGVTASALVGPGLALGLLPSAVVGWDGSVLRPVIIVCIATAVALGAALAVGSPLWRRIAWSALPVATVALILAAGGRIVALFTARGGQVDGRLEAWLLPMVAAVIVVGVCLDVAADRAAARAAERRDTTPANTARLVSQAFVVAAMVTALVVEVAAFGFAPLTAVRMILLVWLFSAVHAVTFWVNRRPLTPLVGWLAIALAAVAVLAGGARLSPTPLELVTVPMAIALLVSGSLQLTRTATARSWPWLAPGVLVLLVPSLMIGFSDAALWRVVALGIAAIGVLVVGLVLRLQAPFLLGCTVVLVHAIVQLWPWISVAYEATPWWLWLGVGGVILIVLAARYEQRIRDIKSIALKVSALR
jgi:hypothetical protein